MTRAELDEAVRLAREFIDACPAALASDETELEWLPARLASALLAVMPVVEAAEAWEAALSRMVRRQLSTISDIDDAETELLKRLAALRAGANGGG